MGVVVSIVIGNMPFGIDIEIKVKAPKMPSISVDLDVEVELKVPHVEVEIKVPDVEVELKVPHVEIDLDIRAKFEAEIRATLEAEAEAKIAHAVKQAVADVKCKMDQAMAHAIAEAVAEANARCDVRCAAEVTAAVASAPKSAATTWKAQPARIAMPAAEIFDAHVNKFMVSGSGRASTLAMKRVKTRRKQRVLNCFTGRMRMAMEHCHSMSSRAGSERHVLPLRNTGAGFPKSQTSSAKHRKSRRCQSAKGSLFKLMRFSMLISTS